MTVVIHGPQGCGKGIHAPIMARHFGCEQIIDDWNGTDPVPAGALVLTNLEVFTAPAGATVIAFADAMKQAGLRPFAAPIKDVALLRAQLLRLQAADLRECDPDSGGLACLQATALSARAALLEEASSRPSLPPSQSTDRPHALLESPLVSSRA